MCCVCSKEKQCNGRQTFTLHPEKFGFGQSVQNKGHTVSVLSMQGIGLQVSGSFWLLMKSQIHCSFETRGHGRFNEVKANAGLLFFILVTV